MSENPLWTDTHCHLADPQFAEDLEDVLSRADAAGVRRLIVVGDTLETSRRALEIARKEPTRLFAAAGLHPHHAAAWNDAAADALRRLIADSRRSGDPLVAVGEIGLDFFYDDAPRPKQIEAFLAQATIARESNLPIVVHCREAYNLLIDLAREHDLAATGGVVHCFSGDASQAAALAEMGFHLGFAGTVTFKKNVRGLEALRAAPLDRIVVETDAPYLAPAPKRGRRNEPAYVVHTSIFAAEALGLKTEEASRLFERNTDRLFRLTS